MRRVFALAVIAACSAGPAGTARTAGPTGSASQPRPPKPVEHHRVDKIELPNFTITVPAGWVEITDKRIVPALNTQGVHAIMMDPPPGSGFTPSIVLQQLAMSADGHAMVKQATVEQCRDLFQQAIAAQTKTTPGKASTAAYGTLTGCDVEVIDPSSPQSARQISLSDGTHAISVLCNRDKGGAPNVDATCESIAKSLVVKP